MYYYIVDILTGEAVQQYVKLTDSTYVYQLYRFMTLKDAKRWVKKQRHNATQYEIIWNPHKD
jgi:hypothetical protein